MNRGERAVQRAARRRGRSKSSFLTIPFRQIQNTLSPLQLISPDQVEQLHAASMHILEEIGLDFLDDEALTLWQQAGAKVDRKASHVWLDREMVLELVAKAPTSFTWLARNPDRNLTVGGNTIIFAPQGGVVFAANLEIGRRPGRLEDYEKFSKLVQMCNVLHVAGEQLIVPHDIDVSMRHLQRLRLNSTLTDKALMEAAHGRIIPNDSLNVARIIFGDPLPDEPVLAGIINVNSPQIGRAHV